MPISQIQQVSVRKLRPNPANLRIHPKRQIAALAKLVGQIGFVVPIIADEHLVILAGHLRLEAAKARGLKTVPVIVLTGLSDVERRAYMLADNKLVEKGSYDRAALSIELNELVPLLEEAGLSIELTGFEAAEIDSLMEDLVDPEHDPSDDLPDVKKIAVSRRGDLWCLNTHRLLCGDAREPTNFSILLGSDRATMMFADPPYNVQISSVQGRGKIKHREFEMASGELSAAEFVRFLVDCLALAAQYSIDGSIHYVCMDWRHLDEICTAGKEVYSELKNLAVWTKPTPGQGTFYKSQHELVFIFKNGDTPHINNFQLGQHGRTRSNVWSYPGAGSFRAGRLDELVLHPTVKPVAMVADAIRDVSRRGDIVMDPFIGSGTTILAAERVGRRAYGLEIDPIYVDVAIRRWQVFTKREAVLQATGQTFDEVAEIRSAKTLRRVE